LTPNATHKLLIEIAKTILPACVVLLVFAWMATTIWRASDFAYQLQPVATLMGHDINAQDFVADTPSMADVSAFFVDTVDVNAPGRYTVPLMLHQGERSVRTEGVLYVTEMMTSLTAELGSDLANSTYWQDIDPNRFIAAHTELQIATVSISHLPFSAFAGDLPVGDHQKLFSHNGTVFYLTLHVVDTTPPTAVLRDITVPAGQAISVDDIVVSVFDLSPIAMTEIIEYPDIFAPGEHEVAVRVADIYGNEAIYTATITRLPNTVPPIFYGVRYEIHSAMGEPILFRAGVYAYDAFGRPIHFDIDTGLLNINERGTYQVTFIATDAWGVSTDVAIYVHIHSVDPAAVYELADELLSRILRDDMTQVQQARAIHNWLADNITYAAAIGSDSVYEAAHQGFIHRRGNCFVFYGLAEILLTRAGIPNLRVDRVAHSRNPADHRWNLINPDDLGWHHFDATGNMAMTRNERFMFTNSQLEVFNQRLALIYAFDFYLFDPTLLPEIVQ